MVTTYVQGTSYKYFGNNPVQISLSPHGVGADEGRSAKVSGSIIHVGGQVFRKATAYSRRSMRIEPGGEQSSSSTFKQNGDYDRPVRITSTPGGPNPGFVEYAVMYPGIGNPNTGMNSLTDFPSIPGSMMNEATTKALLDLVGNSANLGENLATAGQTIRMLANPTTYLANELRQVYQEKKFRPFLRRAVRDIKDHDLTDVAQRYLEYVYGWRPLMQDIYNLVQLAKDETAKPLLIRGRGESSRYGAGPLHTYDEGSNRTWTRIQFNTKSRVRCNIWAQVDPNNQGIRALNQLGLANPAALAWELMSWSFVIDWLLPIGAVLNALTASSGLIWVDGSVSVRLKGRGNYEQRKNFDTQEIYGMSHSHANGRIIYDGYRRSTLGTWPQPGLWLDQDPFRGDRPLKAAALTIVSLGSLR